MDIEQLKVDESLWPEGASHWDMESELFVSSTHVYFPDGKRERPSRRTLANFGRYIPRPTTKQWDENGNPPLGCECEFYDNASNEWERVFVVAYHCKTGEAIFSESLTGGLLYYGGSSEFRPIKTAAERKKEETINQAYAVLSSVSLSESAVEALYDAGMLRRRESE